MSEVAGSQQTPGEKQETDCCSEPLGESSPADTLILDIWMPGWGEIFLLLLNHQVCGALLRRAQEMNIVYTMFISQDGSHPHVPEN